MGRPNALFISCNVNLTSRGQIVNTTFLRDCLSVYETFVCTVNCFEHTTED